jgi:DNA-binding NarL/FixJ family response regulator
MPTNLTKNRRVLIADDDVLVREGVASLLARGPFEVLGTVADADALLPLVRADPPDLVVLDIRMPPTQGTEGLDAARTIRAELPKVGILVLSAHVEVHRALDLLGEGQSIGYLLKSRVTDADGFLESADRVARGGTVIDPAIVRELVAARRVEDPLQELTPREREVLQLMAEGRSNAGIARLLFVTEGTIEKHVHSIMGKLQLPETADDHRRVLAVIAYLDTQWLASHPSMPRIRRTAGPDSSDLGRKPSAGVSAIRSA